MSKSDFSQSLLANSAKPQTAADKIPIIARGAVSDRAKEALNLVIISLKPLEYHRQPTNSKSQVEKFVEEECIPADVLYHSQLGKGEKRWATYPPIMDELKAKAKNLGLWNLFLPKNHFKEGAGFSNLEYGLMAEYMGKSRTASEVNTSHRVFTGSICAKDLCLGLQLCCTGHRQHGSAGEIWQ